MRNSISLATALDKSKIDGTSAYLVLLDVEIISPDTGALVSTMRLVRNSDPVTYHSNTYTPCIFDLTFSAETNAAPRITLSVTEVTGALQAYMEAYGGGVGFNVTMTIVNSDIMAPEVVEFFSIMSASASDWTISFTLGAENETTKTFPRRRQTRDFCNWRFKDASTCKYAGASTSCDLSFLGPNGCQAHSNTINFGGFPGISGNGFRYG